MPSYAPKKADPVTRRTPEEIEAAKEQQQAIRDLKKRLPTTWARLIRGLEIPYLPAPADGLTQDHIRTQCASIVWWDFFGGRTCNMRWPHLDKYVNRAYVKIPKQIIIEGLVILGYPQTWAEARMKEKH